MKKFFRFRFLGILMFLAMIAVFSVAAMFIWNALMPEIFGLPALGYLQAAGMVILARILFGGLGPLDFRHHGRHGGFHHGNPFREKWIKMTDEERANFMRTHRGFHHHPFFEGQSCKKDAPDKEGGKGE